MRFGARAAPVRPARRPLRVPTKRRNLCVCKPKRYLALMEKQQVADVLNEIAVLLELKGENPFKSRAYVNAARTWRT